MDFDLTGETARRRGSCQSPDIFDPVDRTWRGGLEKPRLGCWPWARSLIHSHEAVIHSPAEMVAAWPTTVTRSRWPRAFALSTQKPFSTLWKVTRSTRPASTSWVDGRAPSPCSGGDFDGRTLNARPRTYSATKSRRMSGRRAHLCEAGRHSRRRSPDPHKVVREPSADRQTVKSLQTRSPRRALVRRDDCAG